MKSSGWSLLGLVVIASFSNRAWAEPSSSLEARRPNIIFVLTDDQGYGDLSCHGNPILKTPNLDRLHDEGVRFTDFHVSPTCSPTRSALMTGRHEFKNGVTHTILERERLTLKATTIAQVLKSAGYSTGIFGKWHLGDEADHWPDKRGFDEMFIHGCGGIGQTYAGSCGDVPRNSYFNPTILHNGKLEKTKGYCTDVFFGQALHWMEAVKGQRPFFCYLATNAPHAPLHVRPEDEKRYADKVKDPNVAKFFGMIANIDDNVGLLLGKLKEWGIERDTLVIFMNDNGGTAGVSVFNAGMRGQKVTPWLGGTRASSFWRWPGTLTPGDVDRLAAHIDVFPTLAEIAGAKLTDAVKTQVEGRSLTPLLRDPKAEWTDRILFTHVGRWPKGAKPAEHKYAHCSVRSPRWHLVCDNKDGKKQWQLFDVKADPGEKTDVADKHPEVVKELDAAYDKWWEAVQPSLVNEDAVGPKVNPFKELYEKQFGGKRAENPPRPMADSINFNRDIRPILAENCLACHGPDSAARKAKLRLDRRDVAVAAGAFVPGEPDASEMVRRILSDDADVVMPPPKAKKRLTAEQKELLKKWIAAGAEYQGHWAFIPPVRPAPPAVSNNAWVRHPIDRFVLAKLEKLRLQPSPEADRRTLIRRLSLDLHGLPPSPEEVEAFVSDAAPDAYERLVDRLLQSPRYGERMAMAWLDAARYADTNGFNNDEDRTQWPWRDWVIDAFQQNLPYDRFLIEQLAGDLLPNPTLSQKVATGFLRNQVHNTEGGIIPEEYRVEYVADRVHTTATVFLGLSLQCARCHDHKFDPIAQKEYYQFYAFFNSIAEKQASYSNFMAAEPFIKVPSPAQQARMLEMDRRRNELERDRREREPQAAAALQGWEQGIWPHEIAQCVGSPPGTLLCNLLTIQAGKRGTPQQEPLRRLYYSLVDPPYRRLQTDLTDTIRQQAELEKALPAVMVMQEMPQPRTTHVLKRGQYDQPGEMVKPGVLSALPTLPNGAAQNRLGLAQWLVHPGHPLTARVAVNQWWQMYFGTGLVKTVEDFGATGEAPSHSELLDYLATELIGSGWDVKAMQKAIVMSATYRQSSRVTKELQERDPENRLLARGPRQRLSAEAVRDNALAISGLLRERIGGPSVKPYQPAGLWEDVTVERRGRYVPDQGDGLYRRSMYTFWKRTCPPPALMNFDAPNREVCVARRAVTNTPLQALVLLNDPTYVEAARNLAEHMMTKGGPTPECRLTFAYLRALARPPSGEEQRILLRIHDESLPRFRANKGAAQQLLTIGASLRNTQLDEAEWAAWTTVASAILNLDETMCKR